MISPRLKSFICISLFLLAFASPTKAQHHNANTHQTSAHTKMIERMAELYSLKLDSIIRVNNIQHRTSNDTLLSPYCMGLFGMPTLTEPLLHRAFSGDNLSAKDNCPFSSHLNRQQTWIDNEMLQAYVNNPTLIRIDERDAMPAEDDFPLPPAPDNISISERYAPPVENVTPPSPTDIFGDDDGTIVVRRPNFWTFKANFSLQFTQNYVSDNWYKGGESNNALLAATVLQANYNNQRKLTFDNKLEMKLGFQTSQNDTKHKYKTNSDLIRLTNKLGLQAVKHWYYTVMLQSWTQFYPGYKANDDKVYSDIMSPFESLLSIGMDYQQSSKNNKFKITATISPLALKLKYVGRTSLISNYGLDEGKHTKWEYGSNITINYSWKIIKQVEWTSRIYYFTDYHKSQLEWENTFNLTINKYLSTKLFLFPRFDDSRSRNEGDSNFEFKELLSLGLNVNF